MPVRKSLAIRDSARLLVAGMSALDSLHAQLCTDMQERESAQATVQRLVAELKAARESIDASDHRIASTLRKLKGCTAVTVEALQRTGVGVAVNRLRKHGSGSVAQESRELVETWKKIALRGDRRGVKAPLSAVVGKGAVGNRDLPQPTRAPDSAPRRVLDVVVDDKGRVERRIADPDSHEDVLAMREASEAEAMWEQAMGSGRGAPASGGAPTLQASKYDGNSRLRGAVEGLQQRYRAADEKKRHRQIMAMPPGVAPERSGGFSGAARGPRLAPALPATGGPGLANASKRGRIA